MASLLECVLVAAMAQLPRPPAPGVERDLAEARAAAVAGVSYDLAFDLRPGGEPVRGQVVLRFDLAEVPAHPLIVDFDGKDLHDVAVNGGPADLEPRDGHLSIPVARLAAGRNELTAAFSSPVAATGTPLTRYVDQDDGAEYLYTLVVPADAHRLFPCFDQPDLKATFRLALTMPADWVAVANGVEPAAGQATDGRRSAQFELRQPISTYLFAFAAGPLAVVEDREPAGIGSDPARPIRLLLRRSKLDRLDADLLFAMHRRALGWLGDYFDTPYPFDKLDVALLPGFPYGGMEHAGAIFYRETALTFDHEPTESERIARSTLIYHEVAHQWFGNLVTMRWFDDLWLKEGFATFLGYTLLDALEPGKNAWLRFHQRVKPRAYAIDATRGTTPIYQKLNNLADAKSAYGAIVYNKAPAVLRELQHRLGAARFQQGVRTFLAEHAYGNARWDELVDALERASGDDSSAWSSRWILAAGMPAVRAEWSAQGGVLAAFSVHQESVDGGDGLWPLALDVMLIGAGGGHRRQRVRLDGGAIDVPELVGAPAPAAVLLNPTDVAYGLFLLDDRSREWLLQHAATVADPLARAVALSALRDTVREAECDPYRFAELVLELLRDEADPETHAWLLTTLGTCLYRYLPPRRAEPLVRAANAHLLAALAAGIPGRELQTFRHLAGHCTGEPTVSALRNLLDGSLVLPGLELGRRDRFLAASALLAHGDPAPLAAERAREPGDDGARDAYIAGAAAPDAESKRRYFDGYLDPGEPPEQWIQASLDRFHWPGQEAVTLPFLERALERVEWVKEHRKIFFMPAWIDAFVNAHGSEEALRVVRGFLDRRSDLPADVVQKILQSSDELNRTVRIRSRFGGG